MIFLQIHVRVGGRFRLPLGHGNQCAIMKLNAYRRSNAISQTSDNYGDHPKKRLGLWLYYQQFYQWAGRQTFCH